MVIFLFGILFKEFWEDRELREDWSRIWIWGSCVMLVTTKINENKSKRHKGKPYRRIFIICFLYQWYNACPDFWEHITFHDDSTEYYVPFCSSTLCRSNTAVTKSLISDMVQMLWRSAIKPYEYLGRPKCRVFVFTLCVSEHQTESSTRAISDLGYYMFIELSEIECNEIR